MTLHWRKNDRSLPLQDIQGFVLRQYALPTLRHFLLEVRDPAAARAVIGKLAAGGGDSLHVATAAEGEARYRLHLGITWAGLVALQVPERVPDLSFRSFPSFVEGAAKRASAVGDSGVSGPENWVGGFGSGRDHVLLTLYAADGEALEAYSGRLLELVSAAGAFAELWRMDGGVLLETIDGEARPVPKVHFGYVDGIAQPTIIGAPEPAIPDRQQPCEPWLFVLRDDAPHYAVPEPPEIGRNGSFGVFKMIKQDVVGFENFLQSQKGVIDPELLAAKLCGRWRNGVPLVLSPDGPTPHERLAADRWNDFDYVHKDGSGDPQGVQCPVGSHIRRMNPRGQPVMGQGVPGGSNNSHRLVRRGMPYGPTYVPGAPQDGIERGLLVYFINASIENQYEFVLREWGNDNKFVGASRLHPNSKNIFTGTEHPEGSIFEIPQAGGAPPIHVGGFANFIETRAAAYCFLPSLTAMRAIAAL